MAPISYSVSGGRLHRELRAYKDDPCEGVRELASRTLAAVLDCFLARHQACIAAAAGVTRFEYVTTVPSPNDRADAARGRLRTIVRDSQAVEGRYRRLLFPGAAPGTRHRWSAERYRSVGSLGGVTVLLIDDTWTTGASAQAAALALRRAGAACVVAVVIGRQVTFRHADNARRLGALGPFDWGRCVVHGRAESRESAHPGGALAPPEVPRDSCAG